MKKLTLLIGFILLLNTSSLYADETTIEAGTTMQVEMQANMNDVDKQATSEMTDVEIQEYMAEKKKEKDAEMIQKREELEAKKEERKVEREERKTKREEYISTAREKLLKRIEDKGARLSQIPQDKLINAGEKIEEMIEKYESNEIMSEEVKNTILDQLYALQDMINAEVEVEVEVDAQ